MDHLKSRKGGWILVFHSLFKLLSWWLLNTSTFIIVMSTLGARSTAWPAPQGNRTAKHYFIPKFQPWQQSPIDTLIMSHSIHNPPYHNTMCHIHHHWEVQCNVWVNTFQPKEDVHQFLCCHHQDHWIAIENLPLTSHFWYVIIIIIKNMITNNSVYANTILHIHVLNGSHTWSSIYRYIIIHV